MFNDPVYSIFSYSKNEEIQIDLGNIQSKIISIKLYQTIFTSVFLLSMQISFKKLLKTLCIAPRLLLPPMAGSLVARKGDDNCSP
jgi:hypothetical protein